MKTYLSLLLALGVVIPALAQPAPWSDLIGSWTTSYTDEVLGHVEGYVTVRAGTTNAALPVEIDVTLRHPENGIRTRLSAVRAERRGNIIKLELTGSSPAGPSASVRREPPSSRQLTPPGASPLDPAANELRPPPGAFLTARLRGTEGVARAALSQDRDELAVHSLILEGQLNEGVVTWRWSYPHPGDTPGLRGRRMGAVRDVPGGRLVYGDETWLALTSNGIVAVEQEGPFTPAPNQGLGPEVYATLKIRGWQLPVATPGKVVMLFEDTRLKFDRVLDSRQGSKRESAPREEKQDQLRVRVRVAVGIEGGPKTLSLDGMESTWNLNLPRLLPSLRVLARQPDGTFKPTTMPCVGDVIQVEARFDASMPFDGRLAQVRVANDTYGPLMFRRTGYDSGPHLAPPFEITGSGATRNEAAGTPPKVTADGGDVLVLEGIDSRETIEWGVIPVLPRGARDKATLVVRPDGEWTSDMSLSDLAMDDRFTIMARVPAAQAVTLGETIEVELRALDSTPAAAATGNRGRIPLYRRPARTNAPVVIFAMRAPASFAKGAATSYLFGNFEADSSILDVKGGESVEFAVAGEKVSVRIHDTRLQKRLEVRRRQVAMLLQALSSVAGAPQLSPEERVAILSRASMMNNALIISKSSELYPAERVAVLESYLYLVNEPNLTRANGAASRYGANWVFIEEINAVRHAIDVEAKEVIRSAILGMAKDVTIGMVEFVADRSGVGGIYTAVTGRTVMGQRVNVLNRILAAAGALNNIKQMTASTQWGLDRKANEWMAKADAERVAWRKAEAEKRAAADIVVEGPSSPGFPGGKPPVVPPPGPAPRVSNQSAPGSWPASNTASERLAERLRLAGVEERAADRAAADLLRRNPSVPPAVAEAGLAADAGVPASVVMERAKITADTYASRLDDYYKSVLGIDDPNVRARMTRRAMGDLTPANVRAAAAVADEASGVFAAAPSSTTTVFPKAEVPGSNIITPPGGKAVDGAAKSASSSSVTVVPGRPSPVPVPPRTGSSTTELPAPGIPGSGVASEADHTGDYRFADRIANGLWDPTENGNTSLIGARQPHTGPGYMDRLLQADAEVARVAARSKGESLAAVEATIQRETLRLQELHRSAQVIEDVVGSRRQIDYAQLRLFRNKGCGEQEALVGQFYMNHSAVTPSRAMAALGMDRPTFERTLDQFLSRTQAVTDPQDRANRIKEYLTGQ